MQKNHFISCQTGRMAVTALLVAGLLSIAGCGKNASQGGLGQIAFKYLRNNDFKNYARYIIRVSEAHSMLDRLKDSTIYREYNAAKLKHFAHIRKTLDQRIEVLHQRLKKNFFKTFDYGVRNGIVWSKTRFLKIEVTEPSAVFDLDGTNQQDIYIVFDYNNKHYRLKLRNNVRLRRGWVIVDGLSWEPLPR